MKKILLSSSVAILVLLSGCTEEKSTSAQVEVKKEEIQKVEPQKVEVQKVQEVAKTETVIANKVEEIKEVSKQITQEISNEVKEASKPVVQEAKQTISQGLEKVQEIVNKVEVKGENGEVLYKACASCHGQNGEKPALGKSQIIAGWDKQKIIDALNGYKNGTYGGAMKAIMQGQVSSKSDAQIEALAEFISTL